MNVEWNTPESVPDVEKGTEKEFWVAVRSEHAEKDLVLVAHYQNRPLEFDADGEAMGDFLITPDGEPHHSVGWVLRTEHEDFDGFYTAFQFSEKYCLLGWAEYVPPVFTGVGELPVSEGRWLTPEVMDSFVNASTEMLDALDTDSGEEVKFE